MMHNAVESSTLVRALQVDVSDAAKWAALAEAQTTAAARVQILMRAVETVPASQDLWERLVDAKVQAEGANAAGVLSDALGLFPQSPALWQRMFALAPSITVFTTALRHLDNELVWPAYLQFLQEGAGVTPAQRRHGYEHYCEYSRGEEGALRGLALQLVTADQAGDAAAILTAQSCREWAVWRPLVMHERASAPLLEAALRTFPGEDSTLVPLLAQKWAAVGDPQRARLALVHGANNPSSAASFVVLFRAACEFYEAATAAAIQQKGEGATDTAHMLAEFANLVRKRPMILSDAALREAPHSIALWKQRAQIWRHRPHMAADILETALKTIDPLRATGGELSDLWIEYTRLLIANGSDLAVARGMLTAALGTRLASPSEKAKLHIALAELEQDGAKDPAAAVRVLEAAVRIPALATDCHLWTVYISTLVEAKSPATLEAFSHCCSQQMATMRIVLMVAQSFPAASANQIVVFDKGAEMFPLPFALPLWKRYLAAVHDSYGIDELRALYKRAFAGAEGHRRATEEMKVLYSRAERGRADGSRMLAKRELAASVPDSRSLDLWREFIMLHDDTDEKRQLYEQAIAKLDDKEAARMALVMADFETGLGEIERARAIYRYAAHLSEDLDEVIDAVVDDWHAFESTYGTAASQREMAAALNPSLSIHFVPADMET